MNWSQLNWVDYLIIALIGLSTIFSLWRGFIREVMSLVVWAAAFFVAIYFSAPFSGYFTKISSNVNVQLVISFIILFLVTLFIGAILNFLLSQMIEISGLDGLNRLVGGVFGFVRGLVIVTGVVFLFALTSAVNTESWGNSVLIPKFQTLATASKKMLPASAKVLFEQAKKAVAEKAKASYSKAKSEAAEMKKSATKSEKKAK